MKKWYLFFLASFILSITLTGCSSSYSEQDFLGKTSAEIIGRHGAFDCVTMPPTEDGLYKSCLCGYTVKEARTGLFGKTDEMLFFIHFDGSGTAVDCTESPRPGG